ncbi:MAG: DMT family transporter [Archaeoglobaceae archaeon]
MMSGIRSVPTVLLALTATILGWGWAFMNIKIALNELDPITLTILRFIVADTLFIPYIIYRKDSLLRRGDIPFVFVLGFGGVAIYHLCLNFGEVYIPSGVASLIIATAPVYIFISSIFLLGERLLKTRVMGTVLALTGVTFIIVSGDTSYEIGNYIGALAVLISALSATFYTVYGKSIFTLNRYSPSILTAYSITLGTIPLFLLLTPSRVEQVASISPETWASVLFLGICSTFIAYQGWYYALNKLDASRAAVFLQAIPVVAVTSGVVFLDEPINSFFAIGAVMVIVGVYVVNRK